MKTNHRRGFVATTHSWKGGQGFGKADTFSDKHIGAGVGYSFTKGNRGMAKSVRGAKKFVNSRLRAARDMQVRKLMKEL